MIMVTRLDRQTMYLNPDHIISIESTPDTVITLYNGHHILVRDHCRAVIDRIVAFRAMLARRSAGVPSGRKYLQRKRNSCYRRQESERFVYGSDSGHTAVTRPLHHQGN